MSVTIKQIAEICGVSRENVYRVVNNHGKVNLPPNKILAIRNVAENMGYTADCNNFCGGTPPKKHTIGVVMFSEGNPFFDDVISGLQMAYEDLECYGLTMILKTMQEYDEDKQLELIEEIEKDVDLLILTPINSKLISDKIDKLFDQGLYVITLNTDINNSRRICYVGSDYYHGGRMAGNLIALLSPNPVSLGIVAGAPNLLGHQLRVQGFKDIIAEKYPHLKIVYEAYDYDDVARAELVTRQMLAAHPQIRLIYAAAAGINGVCQGVIAAGREGDVGVVGFDNVPTTISHMKAGLIRAVLFQQPVRQGYKALKTAFYFLVSGDIPDRQEYMINTTIKISENVEDDEYNDVTQGIQTNRERNNL